MMKNNKLGSTKNLPSNYEEFKITDLKNDKRIALMIQVIFVIITDGMENASREYSHRVVREMINHQKTKYDWDFVFLGANFDAEGFAESLSIPRKRAMRYANDQEGINSVYQSMSEEIRQTRELPKRIVNDAWKNTVKKVMKNSFK